MEFGCSLPSRGSTATVQNLRTLAQHAEALGMDFDVGERSHLSRGEAGCSHTQPMW